MNKLITKIVGAALGLTMAVGVGVAVASNSKEATPVHAAETSSTINLASVNSTSQFTIDTSNKVLTAASNDGYIKLTHSGGNNYNNYSPVSSTARTSTRFYSGHTVTITSNDSTTRYLSSIVFTAASTNYASIFTNASTTITNGSASVSGTTVTITPTSNATSVSIAPSGTTGVTQCVVTWDTSAGTTKYTVTYNANGATSGTVPTDSNQYENNATVTVLGNTGTLAKTGYVWSGWNTADDGSGTDRAAGATFSISADTTLYAKWTADTLNSLSISGSMTKTSYKDGDSWNPAGFTVTANYQSGATPDVTSDVTWSYYVGGSVQATAAVGDTSVVVRATYGGKYVESSAQTVNVTAGVTYDLSNNFSTYASSWTNSYTTHTVTHTNVGASVAATMAFAITNKQSQGIGSEYPCIGAKGSSSTNCLTFTLTEAGKKITSIDIVFVTRYTTTYPTLSLHSGSDISGSALESLTMSGSTGDEHTLSCSSFNNTVFCIEYNANGATGNAAVGIKSISIGLANQASFGTLDHITVSSLPNVVYHVGETYDSTGFAVTAYDGADEETANFKDVTSSEDLTVLLEDDYEFLETDVPGIDVDVSYEEDGVTKETSFHVYVYALAEYKLVTEEPADWSGSYLIVGTNSSSELGAMNGGLSNPDVEAGYKVVTADANDVIEAGQELEWTIASYSTGYSVRGKSGKYIGSLTTNANGMLVSDSALLNTLSYSDGATTIAGDNSNHYHLTLQTAGDRFRYYASGTVQLYKLVESDNADAFAQTFLGAFTCDSSGVNRPSFTEKEEGVNWTWALLAAEYNNLTAVEKEQFRLGVASESGDNIARALARYDYVVGKYYITGLDTTLISSDFMARTPSAIGSSRAVLGLTSIETSSATAIIIVVSLVSLTAIGGYFFIRKRKEQ